MQRLIGLYGLCEMFAERYAVIARVELNQNRFQEVKYEYSLQVEDTPDRRPTAQSLTDPPRHYVNSRLRQLFGVPAPNLRIPVPLAKKTDHYLLEVPSPNGFFFSKHEIIANPRTPGLRWEEFSLDKSVDYSRNSFGGRKALSFLHAARTERTDRLT